MSYEDLRWYIGIVYELLMAVVRTGEFTPYANVILVAGVVF